MKSLVVWKGRFTEGLLGNLAGRFNGPKQRAVCGWPWLGGIQTKLLLSTFYQGGGGHGEADGGSQPGLELSW